MSVESDLRHLIKRNVSELQAYTPVESPESLAQHLSMPIDMILKLDSNENPYGCSILVQEALGAFDRYHQYPDAEARRIRERLAIYTGSSADRIVVGNGSDEIIDLVLIMLLESGDEVLIPTPTFGVYRARTGLYGGVAVEVPRTDAFDLDIEAMLQRVTSRTKVIFACSPNNPTGNLATNHEIVKLLETGAIVIVDEAYFEFSGKSVLPLTGEFDNLVVLRTFSKWAGIAGLRFGYGILPEFLIDQYWKVKPPFNVGAAQLQAAEASLDDIEYLHMTINRIRNESRRLYRRLGNLDFLKPYPTVANFILCDITEGNAHDIHQRLNDRGIMVRAYADPKLRNFLRISVGRPEDTDRLISALKTIGSHD